MPSAIRNAIAKQKGSALASTGFTVSDELLARLVDERAVLSDEDEKRLEREIAAAARELIRRRGGPDAELQLCKEIGEIYPL